MFLRLSVNRLEIGSIKVVYKYPIHLFIQVIVKCVMFFLYFLVHRLGCSIGTYPVRYIIGCVVVCLLCGLGLLNFSEQTEPNKLWVPENAQVIEDLDWISKNFPSRTRVGFLMGVSGNVLSPGGLTAVSHKLTKMIYQ